MRYLLVIVLVSTCVVVVRYNSSRVPSLSHLMLHVGDFFVTVERLDARRLHRLTEH